jgi:hypothetical protein
MEMINVQVSIAVVKIERKEKEMEARLLFWQEYCIFSYA